jgi:WD40 repeat protein/transcriptional regulator with XRE-family HTH domain
MVNWDILPFQTLRRLYLLMPRASRSWRVRDDCIEIVKNTAIQKYGRQEDLAEEIGISRATVSKYLNGRSVDIAQFKEISFFLGFNDGTDLACLPDGSPLVQTSFKDTDKAPIQAIVPKAAPQQSHRNSFIVAETGGRSSTFYGRHDETTTLTQWVLDDCCQVLSVLGLGGIGKTTLVQKVIAQFQSKFEIVIWRSLRQSPPLEELLSAILKSIFPEPDITLPDSTSEMIVNLLQCLRNMRCLIVLDDMESIFVGSDTKEGVHLRAGYCRQGYEDYGELIRQLGESAHQSCLLLTSREKPKEIAALEDEKGPVRSLILRGLDSTSAQPLLENRKLTGTTTEFNRLITVYDGNPLSLKIVASTIQDLFASNIAGFLAAGTIFFGHVGQLLDEQFNRLSSLEQDIMFWLAIHQEPISHAELADNITTLISRRELLEALTSLGRRSLIETDNTLVSQQSVVMEYTLERLVAQICREIVTGEPVLLNSHALLKASAKDYIRESQIRLILEPVLSQLTTHFKAIRYIVAQCQQIIEHLQQSTSPASGYTTGNLINLLCQLQVDLTGYNFSHLSVWQAYLCHTNLHQVNFSHTDLNGTSFKAAFGGILTLDLSTDGTLLVTGGTDGAVRLWRIADGKLLWISRGHNHWVFSLSFSPDQTKIISGSPDATLRVWDVKTGEQLNLWRNTEDEVTTLDCSLENILVVGGSAPQATLIDLETGKYLRSFQGHGGSRILAVAFSPDGRTVLTGSTDHTLKLWEVETGNCLYTFVGHTDGVRSVTFSPDGKMIASGSIDCTIKLWQIDGGECWQTLTAHQRMIQALAFSPDGLLLTSASLDCTLRVWQVESGQCTQVLKGHTKPVWSIAYCPDGKTIISGGDDHAVKFWDIDTGQCLKTWQGNSNAITSIAFPTRAIDRDRPTYLLASGSEDRNIRLWDIESGKCYRTLVGHKGRVVSLQYSSDRQTLLSGSWDGSAKLWNINTGDCIATFYGHTLLIWCVAFSPDSQIIATASDDGTIRLWESDGRCLQVLAEHQGAVHTIAFSPDAQVLASGGIDGALRLWAISEGKAASATILAAENSPIRTLTFSADGNYLISTSKEPTIKLWNLKTGQCEKMLKGHRETVWTIDMSSDGSQLASGGEDRTIKLWELASGTCLKTLMGHRNLVVSVSFHPEQPLLVSGCLDETIKIWDIQTGACLNTLHVERPYEDMNITGVTGLSEAQKETLKTLGAIES